MLARIAWNISKLPKSCVLQTDGGAGCAFNQQHVYTFSSDTQRIVGSFQYTYVMEQAPIGRPSCSPRREGSSTLWGGKGLVYVGRLTRKHSLGFSYILVGTKCHEALVAITGSTLSSLDPSRVHPLDATAANIAPSGPLLTACCTTWSARI
jgi:hypothetical protein